VNAQPASRKIADPQSRVSFEEAVAGWTALIGVTAPGVGAHHLDALGGRVDARIAMSAAAPLARRGRVTCARGG